jgi:transposase
MGQKHYAVELKAEVVAKYQSGESVWALHKEYGVSRHGIQRWCGLDKVANMQKAAPRRRGRPPKGNRVTEKDKDNEIKRLTMENELLRDFLRVCGRR